MRCEAHVLDILDRIGEPEQTLRYAQADEISVSGARWLIIDNIGLLNTLYRYGWAAYIGGGLGKGIHNTLEPAAWGLPVLFGPNYHKFEEAKQMVALGGAFSVSDAQAFEQVLKQLNDPISHRQASEAVLGYLNSQKGATDIILQYIRSLY
jgi:3-deoxy-D-manno-octulosonic-acid transferase